MTCDDCRSGLVFYIGHQVSEPEESAIAGHLGECEACRRELEEEIRFARKIHNTSASFRQATLRIEDRLSRGAGTGENSLRRFGEILGRAARSRIGLVTGLALCAVAASILLFRMPDRGMDQVSSWAVDHYPLIGQTHPLHGDAEAVRLWFKEHHQIDVSPPRSADYSTLAGCKMAEIDSEPAPLLRFEGKDTSAVFMLPSKFLRVASAGTIRKGGYIIRVWSEGESPYLKITRDAASFEFLPGHS